MDIDRFQEYTINFWRQYFTRIAAELKIGNLYTDGTILYFNIVLFTETSDHFLVELLGATEEFNGLRIKTRCQDSTVNYLSQFETNTEVSEPALRLDGKDSHVHNMMISHEIDKDIIKDRFPAIELFESEFVREGGKGTVVTFGSDFTSTSFNNSILINQKDNLYRCKYMLHLDILDKSITLKDYGTFLNRITQQKVDDNWQRISSVHIVGPGDQKTVVSGQLQSLYLFPGLRETTIGDYVSEHTEIITDALGGESIEYEKRLDWVDDETKTDREFIRPDVLIRRNDGSYDILDFKKAFLEKKSITTGNSRNRKFLSRIEKGASQLAQYEHYFESEKNRTFAKNEHGIQVDNPKKILVVGPYDNAKPQEIEEATRRFDGIEIIHYDTLVSLFMRSG